MENSEKSGVLLSRKKLVAFIETFMQTPLCLLLPEIFF
jgi:hypothetical protein